MIESEMYLAILFTGDVSNTMKTDYTFIRPKRLSKSSVSLKLSKAKRIHNSMQVDAGLKNQSLGDGWKNGFTSQLTSPRKL